MSLNNSFDSPKYRKRFIFLSIALAVVLLVSYVSQRLYISYVHDHWQAISLELDNNQESQIQKALQAYQHASFESVHRIAQSEKIFSLLLKQDSLTQTACFEVLQQYPVSDLSIELYDAQKNLLSWSGNRNPIVDTVRFQPEESSFILQGSIYTYLILVSPVIQHNSMLGYVVGKRLFDVNYPINNRFVNDKAFSGTFTEALGIDPDFDFSDDAHPDPDGRVLSIPLNNFQSRQMGFAYLPRSLESGYVDEASKHFELITQTVAFVLLLLLIITIYQFAAKKFHPVVKIMFSVAGIWLLRYILVWTNLSAQLVGGKIFDPAYFASSFGFGIAQSVGDLLISSVCLLLTVVIVVLPLLKRHTLELKETIHSALKNIRTIMLLVVLALLVCLMMRGYSATIQSAVFDSTLSYNDATDILPSFGLLLMLASLFVVGFSLVLAVFAIMFSSYLYIRKSFNFGNGFAWTFLICIVTFVSILFGELQPHPLLDQSDRLFYLYGLISLVYLFTTKKISFSHPFNFKSIVLMGGFAVLILVPQLDKKVHDLDQLHIELAAQEIVRPKDTWMNVILNQALDEIAGRQAVTVLLGDDNNEKEGLAFTQWAKSILSRQGFNCSVTYLDRDGNTVSDFHIGIPPDVSFQHPAGEISLTRSVTSDEQLESGVSTRSHIGYAPIITGDSVLIGGVRLEIVSGKQKMLNGSTADVLRNFQNEETGSQNRDIIFSEYVDGNMNYTTNDRFPLIQQLPGIADSLHSNGVWVNQFIDSKEYKSYFLPDKRDVSSDAWISLSVESPGLRSHFYNFTRYVMLFLLFGLLLLMVTLMIRYVLGERVTVGFKTKLFIAFMIVSFVPLAILVYYNRQYAFERIEDSIIKKLGESTLTIEAELQKQSGITVPYALSQLTDFQCENIASDMGIDFHVFSGTLFQASSKPELFIAELVDEHLSAGAYYNLFLKRKSFFYEAQSIGKYPCIVGYRPLIADDGSIIGIVAVPSLFQQAVLDEESTKSNIFLFGTYIVAMLCAVIIGTIFANQISSPVRRLKIAAGKIASGDLDIHLIPERKDELGELEQAFMNMSKELKNAQEQALKAQRELAWKEMAKQVAHEIKNPLTPMKLSIQHLRQAYKDGAANFGSLLDQISKTVLEQIEALSRIASEFSHYGRMPERKLERCNLGEILHEAVHLFEQHANVTFTFEGTLDNIFLQADREELRRAFVNVIRNAVQAMNERGRIILSVDNNNTLVNIHIKDNGPGIEEEIQHRLFEPNFSTKTDGMGLGLSIVRKIIEDLDGSVQVTSKPGVGTTVTIMLPTLA